MIASVRGRLTEKTPADISPEAVELADATVLGYIFTFCAASFSATGLSARLSRFGPVPRT